MQTVLLKAILFALPGILRRSARRHPAGIAPLRV
jgi:hypothetical protein